MRFYEAIELLRQYFQEKKRNKQIVTEMYHNLSTYCDFELKETNNSYRFTKCKEVADMFAEYPLSELAGNGSTMSKAQRIMQWIADNSKYNGASPLGPSLPDKILEFGFKQKNAINCANRSILFSDALISIGIFAFPVFLQNRTNGCCHVHVIAQVWLPEYNKWGIFDPSFNTYYVHEGSPLDVPTLASLVRKNEKYHIISNETGKTTDVGRECTKIGLVDISILPGNDLKYRYHFDELYHFVPKSYNNESCKNIIGAVSFNKEPVWENTTTE